MVGIISSFYNSTGIVWEDALAGLRLFKMDIIADNLQSVIDYFGGSCSI